MNEQEFTACLSAVKQYGLQALLILIMGNADEECT